jgi:uncharacterized protein involved in type VI secretion and phage assembly
LTMDHESHWARVVGLGAANDRGFYCLPEIDDEVLVGFEHGDIHRPYIVGGVWNGKDKTVEEVNKTVQNGQVRLRTIKTRTGHTIQFVEERLGDSKAGIYIKTIGGHRIDINDSEEFIKIKTDGGHSIKMDDNLLEQKIEISTAAFQSIALNDTTMSISLDAHRAVNIDSKFSVDITALGRINLAAPVITMEGAVNIAGALSVEGMTNLAGGVAMEGGVGITGVAEIDGVPIV